MDRHVFPAWIVATATLRAVPEAVDGAAIPVLGDPFGLFGVRLRQLPAAGLGRVRVSVDAPGIMEPSVLEADLPAGDAEALVLPKVRYDYDRLLTVRQQVPIDVIIGAEAEGRPLGEWAETCTLRSINDCPFVLRVGDTVQDLSFMFAAYVNEAHPWIDGLLKEALERGAVSVFEGAQSGRPARVLAQVYAVWDALRARGVHYSSITATPAHSESVFSQHVRFLDETIVNEQANCVDGTVLLASVLRRLSIEPFLVLVPGHMFLAVQLPQAEGGLPVVGIETTLIGAEDGGGDHPGAGAELAKLLLEMEDEVAVRLPSRANFERAVGVGTRRLAEAAAGAGNRAGDFRVVSIVKARQAGLMPLAYRPAAVPPAIPAAGRGAAQALGTG
jgi:hypothetical protein